MVVIGVLLPEKNIQDQGFWSPKNMVAITPFVEILATRDFA
jgi:hypothetical protein